MRTLKISQTDSINLTMERLNNSEKLEAGGLKIVTGINIKNQLVMCIWAGNQSEPYSKYSYRNETDLINAAILAIKNAEGRQESKTKYKTEKKAKTEKFAATVKVGDIFSASWGYDQTNVDFYQVVQKSGKKVTLRELKQEYVKKDGFSSMSGHTIALPNQFVSEETSVHFLQDECIKFTSYKYGYLWDGKPEYVSWYA